jgi:hypothetical protein
MGVDDALRYDFKSFSAPKTRYGMSSVLTPLTGEDTAGHGRSQEPSVDNT